MDNELLSGAIKVVSFDVFDTVLSRIVAEPSGVFDLMAHRIRSWNTMLPGQLKDDFTLHRMRAERKARATSRQQDIGLPEIYQLLSDEFDLRRNTACKLKALEIKTELKCVFAVLKTVAFIRRARNAGKRIIFVSDMYLPKAVIAKMLNRAGAYEQQDRIYLSGEIGLTKASGGMFDYVLNMENCSPNEILHVGDHRSSDFRRPKQVGIQTIRINDTHLNRYEKALLLGTNSARRCNHHQAFAGASRKARLAEGNSLEDPRGVIYRIGSNIAGPILFLYALWVLREAVSRNVKRLYFMARDGQAILNVARKILVRLGYPLELRYLYGSRQAWNLPSIAGVGEEEIKWIVHAEPFLTIRMLAMRLGLAPDLLASYLAGAQFKAPNLDAHFTAQDLIRLRCILLQDDSIKMRIQESAASARKALLTYLDQEKLTTGTPLALVDTGWYGSSQVRLKKILDASGYDVEMAGFYFGLRSKRSDVSQVSYFFDTTSPVIYQKWGKAFISIFEVLCSADHGMTIGYAFDEKGIVCPQLKEIRNRAAFHWGLESLRRGIDEFAEAVPSHVYETDPLEYRNNILELIKLLISRPDFEEAESLGGFRFSSEQTEQQLTCLAPPLSLQMILSSLIDISGVKRRTVTFWPEASILRSGPLVRGSIPLAAVRPLMSLFAKN